MSSRRSRSLVIAVLFVLGGDAAKADLSRQTPGNYDVRRTGGQELSRTAGAEVVRSVSGALTAPAPGRTAAEIVRAFLRANTDRYGLTPRQVDALEVIGESVSPSGLRMVRLLQKVHGLPVFQSETRAILDREGRLVRTVGRLAPGVIEEQVPPPSAVTVSPRQALGAALSTVGLSVDPAGMEERRRGATAEVDARHPAVPDRVSSRLVYFPLRPHNLVPAWLQVIFLPAGDADWITVVDARTKVLLYRKNIRSHRGPQEVAADGAPPARFSVYVQADGTTPADNPAPQSPNTVQVGDGTQFPGIARTVVTDTTGWIPPGGETTAGPNVIAYLDRDADDQPDPGALDVDGFPRGNFDAQGNRRDFLGPGFELSPAPQGGDPDQGQDPGETTFQRGAVTNLFHLVNWYHDRLAELGFDAAAGNFENDDPVRAEAQQGAAIGRANNANFATPPDGQSGVMRMFVFNTPTPKRDGSLDSDTALHEATHGVSNRLIGDSLGLNWFPGLGMGEGWSDFVELSLLNNTQADDPDGQYPPGPYVTYRFQGLTDNYVYGIRRFPYTTDNKINPLTWADVDDITADLSGGIESSPLGLEALGANEVHNVGEVWAVTLWEVRSRIIAAHGGNVALGNHITLQIVVDALKMTPLDPSFTEARDALLDADCAANACAHEAAIWGGFADRGLGWGAWASEGVAFHHGVRESFLLPQVEIARTTIEDPRPRADGNGFADPGERFRLTIELRNPWRQVGRDIPQTRAALTCVHPGARVLRGTATYGAIPPQGTAIASFELSADPEVACGESLVCWLQTESALGTYTQPVELRLGRAAGLGEPAVFTRDAGAVDIPDPFFDGGVGAVTDTFSIRQDLLIGDLDLRLDDLRHVWVGDLAIVLKAPTGRATDLIYRLAGGTDQALGSNDGHNFFRTVIDDESTQDLLVEPSASAPFIGNWLPSLNSSQWDFPAKTGQLAGYDGGSTRGDWQLWVGDLARGSAGTLHSWSLIVSPVRFVCSTSASDLRLLSIHSEGVTFSGQRVSAETQIFRKGLTEVAIRLEPPGTGQPGEEGQVAQLMQGYSTTAQRNRLTGALTAGEVGKRAGGCGTDDGLFPEGFVRHTVTWYGRSGRTHTFTVGADFRACDAPTRSILEAIGDYLVAVRDRPGTVFIPGPEPPPLPLD